MNAVSKPEAFETTQIVGLEAVRPGGETQVLAKWEAQSPTEGCHRMAVTSIREACQGGDLATGRCDFGFFGGPDRDGHCDGLCGARLSCDAVHHRLLCDRKDSHDVGVRC